MDSENDFEMPEKFFAEANDYEPWEEVCSEDSEDDYLNL